METTVRVGVIGLGFMGRTHIAAYQAARAAGYACDLVAVADRDAVRLTGRVDAPAGNMSTGGEGDQPLLFDPAVVRGFTDAHVLLHDPGVDLVSICTHTDTHVSLALAALEAGKHVLLEKPVALSVAEVRRVADAARASGRVCMPAMCMRFWPAWAWLKARIVSGEFGRVHTAMFQRLGSAPAWGVGFYGDASKSGGALVDLHIHDTDFVHYCFGPPRGVTCCGTLNHLTTMYHYDHGPRQVVAEGGWGQAPGFGFRMRYVVNFERGTADFDLGREAAADGTSRQLLWHEGSSTTAVDVGLLSGYDGEVRHLIDVIQGKASLLATVEDAAAVMRTVELERGAVGG